MQKTWFVTGATRGLGASIARAALAAGCNVIATGRSRAHVGNALGSDSAHLLTLELDVTSARQASVAVDAAMARFGAIDVLVNNAGYWQTGLFEETTTEDAHAQFETNFFGALNVTRAALPSMRLARSGRIFNVSSLGGLLGAELGSLYCASKFALEGFSECLAKEVAPFGIFVTIVEPGPFRTDFLTPESIRSSEHRIPDYDPRRSPLMASFKERNGQQPGDPSKLARALVQLSEEIHPPLRFLAGSIAVNAAKAKLESMRAESEAWRHLSVGTDGDYDSSNVAGLLDRLK